MLVYIDFVILTARLQPPVLWTTQGTSLKMQLSVPVQGRDDPLGVSLWIIMMKKKVINDYGTGIPKHEADALAALFLPRIRAFFEDEENRKAYEAWKRSREETGQNQ